jgi:hypothetical protein
MGEEEYHHWVVETSKVLTELFDTPIRPGKFPGCLPVDVTYYNLIGLSYGYVMSYKADGDRAFLFQQGRHCWLYHRSGKIECLSPPIQSENSPVTLFDCEVMTGTNRIFLFDTLMYSSRNILRTDYLQRLELSRKWCQGGTVNAIQTKHIVPTRYLDTTIQIGKYQIMSKPVYPTTSLSKLVATTFAQDGLIFTQLRSAYLPYRSSMVQVLKWKPPSHLTIDVHFTYWDTRRIRFHPDIPLSFHPDNNKEPPHYTMSVLNDSKVLVPFSLYVHQLPVPLSTNCPIYEVGWTESSGWFILKHRKDKRSPNALSTALATLQLIEAPVHHSDLVDLLTPVEKPADVSLKSSSSSSLPDQETVSFDLVEM